MEGAPENGRELLHSAHANGMNEWISMWYTLWHKSACVFHLQSYLNMEPVNLYVNEQQIAEM